MKPKSILDPNFRYIPAVETDLRKTFARIRREQKARDLAKAAEEAQERLQKVVNMKWEPR